MIEYLKRTRYLEKTAEAMKALSFKNTDSADTAGGKSEGGDECIEEEGEQVDPEPGQVMSYFDSKAPQSEISFVDKTDRA